MAKVFIASVPTSCRRPGSSAPTRPGTPRPNMSRSREDLLMILITKKAHVAG